MFVSYKGAKPSQAEPAKASKPIPVPPPKAAGKVGDVYSTSLSSSYAASRANSPPMPPPSSERLSVSPDKRAQQVNQQTFLMDALFR